MGARPSQGSKSCLAPEKEGEGERREAGYKKNDTGPREVKVERGEKKELRLSHST